MGRIGIEFPVGRVIPAKIFFVFPLLLRIKIINGRKQNLLQVNTDSRRNVLHKSLSPILFVCYVLGRS